MRKHVMIISFLFFVFSMELFGQADFITPRQLSEAISSGDVTLTANGNGSSSGSAVIGTLKNNKSNEIFINVVLNDGIYLRNSGSGQNMVAAQVFLSNGVYTTLRTNKFIRLSPNANTQIMFLAFCADFERDNPAATEFFSYAAMPSGIQTISSKISRYMADKFDEDITIPIQLALWRSQEQSWEAISEKFIFDDSDWEIATRIMNY
ncbi:MAG: hypothetical protein LBR96_01395 [Treponema sp.]|jgi:hypothetical protein|nr:hypothetical protein [Treponema sp.]